MTARTSPEANREYVAGRCVDGCGRPYSAGRPRCDECHSSASLEFIEPVLTRRGT